MLKEIPDPSELPFLSQGRLNDMIEKHARFLRGESGGARAVLQYYNLSGLNFRRQNLAQADFTASSLAGCDLSDGVFTSANFFACDLRNTNFFRADLSRCDLRGAYLAGANLERANLFDADMREGKIMLQGEDGTLTDRKRSAGVGAKTIFKGAKLGGTNMDKIQAHAADFSDADLSGVSLVQANLSGVNFEGANLSDTNMTETDLTDVNMQGSIISGMVIFHAERHGLDLSGAVTERQMGKKLAHLGRTLPELLEEHKLWVSSAGKRGRQLDLSGYDMRDVIDLKSYPLTAIKAREANFLRQNLSDAKLQSANFERADFRDCLLRDADLRGSSFKYAQMARADLNGAMLNPLVFKNNDGSERLSRTDMSGASLIYARLSDCDLRDAIFMGADLTGAVIRDADLRRANFTGAILAGAVFENVKLDGAIIDIPD